MRLGSLTFITLIIILIALIGCWDDGPFTPKDNNVINIKELSPLPDDIPFENLGSGKLVFSRGRDIYVIDVDNQRNWGFASLGGRPAEISPNGELIAFCYDGDVFIMGINGENLWNMSNSKYECKLPTWTPDSKQILYQEASVSFYLCPAIEGSQRTKIRSFTSSTVSGVHEDVFSKVSISIDEMLVFSYYKYEEYLKKTTHGLFMMNMEGDSLIQLTDTYYHLGESPSWSSDGTKIAFIKHEMGIASLIIIDKYGNELATLLSDIKYRFWRWPSLCWSPDGSKLAFNMADGDRSYIYVINIDGTELTRVTSGLDADDYYVSWSR